MRLLTAMYSEPRDWMSRCTTLGLVALSMLACAAALRPAPAAARGNCPDQYSTVATAAPALRASVLCLVNVTRLQRGLPALQRDARLETAAQRHTDDMINRDLTHTGSDGSDYYQRIVATGYPIAGSDSGENIAQGNQTPAAVVDGWLQSLDHCQVTLIPGIRDLGVGVNPGAASFRFPGPTWTQNFARVPSEPALSTNTAPRNGCPYALAPPSVGPRPTASTSLATAITVSSATVNGTANANGGGFTSVHVDYGTTTGYGSQTPERVVGTSGVTVTETLSGLAAGTYHFQVVAMNQNGETRSVDRVFTTTGSPARPLVSTGAPTAVTQTTATLNGSVNPAGRATTYRFEYGLTTGYGSSTTSVAAGADTIAQAASMAIIGLTPGTLYHARMVATNSDGTTFGTDVSFTTLAPPVVVTRSATPGVTTATLTGSVNPRGKATTYRFEYGTTTSYGTLTTPTFAGSGTAAQAVSAVAGGLTAGTTYHFRIVATNADGTANGADVSFTTLAPPTAVTGTAGASRTTATLNGSVDPNGRATTYRFDYGTTTAYGQTTAATSAGSGDTAQAVSSAISGLTAGTTYHARIVASNADGTTNGMDITFTTTGAPPPPPPPPPLAPPTTVTGSVSGIATTTATLNGSVNPRGHATTYRFERGTTTSYGTSTTAASAGSGTVPQAVAATLTGLTPRTTYHVRLVAANSDGTTNGLDVAFTTASTPSSPPPSVVVTGLKLSPSKFRAAKSGASVTTAAVRNGVRTRVSYTLSHAARVRFTVDRSSEGRRVDGRCVKSTPSNSRRVRCRRYVRVSGSFARSRSAGIDRFTFTGRIGGRPLRSGRYRLLVTPGTGRTVRATFRVMK